MSEVYFYQTAAQDAFGLVRGLLRRSLSTGWRVAVRAGSDAALAMLDADLWKFPEDEFLPHGLEGGPFDEEQPILLTMSAEPANRANAMLLFDCAETGQTDIERCQRVSIVFCRDSADELRMARSQWAEFSQSGIAVRFWVDQDGKWVQKAEKNTETT